MFYISLTHFTNLNLLQTIFHIAGTQKDLLNAYMTEKNALTNIALFCHCIMYVFLIFRGTEPYCDGMVDSERQ